MLEPHSAKAECDSKFYALTVVLRLRLAHGDGKLLLSAWVLIVKQAEEIACYVIAVLTGKFERISMEKDSIFCFWGEKTGKYINSRSVVTSTKNPCRACRIIKKFAASIVFELSSLKVSMMSKICRN